MATEVLTSLATELYEVVQQVKGNKERCKEIGERAQRLVPALRRLTSTPGDDQEVRKKINSLYLSFFFFPPSSSLEAMASFFKIIPPTTYQHECHTYC